MNVLSLFDGISCGALALERAGIPVKHYFASEVDPYAIKTSKKNWPNITRLGSVMDVQGKDLPRIDLLIGGSPCQGFSFAGGRLNFDDPRSKLFFEYVRLLRETNPKYFLLENVPMDKKSEAVITETLGVKPVMINSALVSAQNRKRLYWANFPITQPADKHIMLEDILLPGVLPVGAHNLYGGFNEKKPRVFTLKSPTIRTAAGGGHIPSLLHTKKGIDYMNRVSRSTGETKWEYGYASYADRAKSACVVANFLKGVPNNVLVQSGIVRKFDPIEAERLQTLPDNYTEGVSNTQRYRQIGNGWTVDVVAHILRGIK
jgi:DNA (cytosine-5)-methyltransferase 3A